MIGMILASVFVYMTTVGNALDGCDACPDRKVADCTMTSEQDWLYVCVGTEAKQGTQCTGSDCFNATQCKYEGVDCTFGAGGDAGGDAGGSGAGGADTEECLPDNKAYKAGCCQDSCAASLDACWACDQSCFDAKSCRHEQGATPAPVAGSSGAGSVPSCNAELKAAYDAADSRKKCKSLAGKYKRGVCKTRAKVKCHRVRGTDSSDELFCSCIPGCSPSSKKPSKRCARAKATMPAL